MQKINKPLTNCHKYLYIHEYIYFLRGVKILKEESEGDVHVLDIESDDEVEEMLENDEISSEEAAFLRGWNNSDEEE